MVFLTKSYANVKFLNKKIRDLGNRIWNCFSRIYKTSKYIDMKGLWGSGYFFMPIVSYVPWSWGPKPWKGGEKKGGLFIYLLREAQLVIILIRRCCTHHINSLFTLSEKNNRYETTFKHEFETNIVLWRDVYSVCLCVCVSHAVSISAVCSF